MHTLDDYVLIVAAVSTGKQPKRAIWHHSSS